MDYEKLHKDTIAKLQEMVNSGKITVEVACGICADFVPESEDERIRKDIVFYIAANHKDDAEKAHWLYWLEKQKERSPLSKDEEYTLARIIEYLEDNDCPSEWKDLLHDVYALPYQKEQKPADKVEPKFKFGDRVRNKKSGVTQILGSCIEDVYEGAFPFRIKDQDDWELVEQKPAAWSEEDEKMIIKICQKLYDYPRIKSPFDDESFNEAQKEVQFIKSLKDRVQPQNTWKPSDEQMQALSNAGNSFRPFEEGHKVLWSLYNDLKKLKE